MAVDEIRQSIVIDATLKNIQGQLKTLEGDFQKSFSRINSVAQTALSAIGVGMLTGFAKSVIDIGDNLSDLSDITGLTVETLGGLRVVAEQNGTSLDAVAKGVLKAQKNLGEMNEDGQGAAKALKILGLNAKEMIELSPDDFMLRFAQALGKVGNQNERAAIAAAVLGRSGAELNRVFLQIAENGLPKISSEAAAGFKVLGEFKDAMVAVAGEAVNFWAALVGRGAQALAGETFAEQLAREQAAIETLLRTLASRGQVTAGNRQLEELEFRLQGIVKLRKTLESQPAESKKGSGLLGFGNADAIKKSSDQLNDFIAGLKKQADQLRISEVEMTAGALAAKALGLDLEFAAFRAKLLADTKVLPPGMTEQFKAARAEILGLNAALLKTKELMDRLAVDEKDAAEGRQAREQAELAPFKAADEFELQRQAEAAERATRDFDDLAAATRDWDTVALESFKVQDELAKTLERISKQARIIGPDFDALGARIQAVRDAMLELNETSDEFQRLKEQLKELTEQRDLQQGLKTVLGSITSGIEDTLRGVIQGTQKFGAGMKNLMRNIAISITTEFAKILLNKGLQQLIEAVSVGSGGGVPSGSSTGTFFAGLLGSIGSLFGGSFAEGGVVSGPIGAPRLAMVHGGETVLPTHQQSSGFFGDTVVYNIDARGAQRGVSVEIQRAIDESRRKAVEESFSHVVSERRRSGRMAKVFSR